MVWQQEHKLAYENFLEKHNFVLYCLLVLFITMSVRLLYLQVVRGNYYKDISEQQHIQIILERAPRGIIYDRFGNKLVENKTAFVALFYPFAQYTTPPKELLIKLNKIFPVKNLTTRLIQSWSRGKVVRLAEDLSLEEMFRIQEQRLLLPGISVIRESKREYTDLMANSHLVGYLSEITAKELENVKPDTYKMGDYIGRSGIEKVWDGTLRGQDGGWQIEVDAYGHQTRLIRHIPSSVGGSIYTTIDANLQKAAYEGLEATLKLKKARGAVIGIDPRSGAVRILVSSPGFDPEKSFSREFNKYITDKDLPLFNRAIQALYPPGSIFKIITFVGALEEKVIDPSKTFLCTGQFAFGDKVFKCWEKKGHGRLSLLPALSKSCDVYFYQLGLKSGSDLIEKYAKMFRLDKQTGIELAGEKKGLIPSKEWKMARFGQPWTPGDTINMAIGQGFLWVTPIEMAVMMSAVANGGTLYKPYLLDRIESSGGEILSKTDAKKLSEIQLSPEVWQLIKEGLEEVVKTGTGQGCFFKNLKVSGKTGTAQNPQGDDHAWFIAYAPSDNPELALTIIVENGGHGGSVAAPIARKIFKEAFKEETKNEW
ncbi:MAG: penicillin-binding protein 2 [Elusimicrobia bacterium]|nr:penicillin-binding protein 2 [Candidatus Liberimonas magnetica]